MKPTTHDLAAVPSTALLASSLGCKANCHTCANAFADSDGEHGEIFCGTTCTAGKAGDETYLEDAEISLDEEKDCWEPDFWKVPGTEFVDLIGDDGDPSKAYAAFWAKVDSIKANDMLTVSGGQKGD